MQDLGVVGEVTEASLSNGGTDYVDVQEANPEQLMAAFVAS